VTEYVFDVNESINLGARSEELHVVGNGVDTVITEFPSNLLLVKPGVYTVSQTPISGTDVIENFYVKIPASESNTQTREDMLVNPYMYTDSIENNTDLILLDGGDFCQGTPYYNFYHGRVEIEAMNRMGYDASTLGNHEFDYGVDTLAKVLEMAQFPIVCANYDVKGTPLEGVVVPYTVIKRSGVRVGVFGLGVNPTSLIAEKNFAPIKYLDPIAKAQEVADILREEEKCDVVVCLSHQGTHPMGGDRISDIELASKTKNIDVIIGAHTHKIVENLFVENLCGDSVLLAQTGKAGARIGEISLKIAQ
jgi:5'-nucleotidase